MEQRHFNPRSPHGERHAGVGQSSLRACDFNPRSPHGERHGMQWHVWTTTKNFNPRSPHGERRSFRQPLRDGKPFQPTLPARGATPFYNIVAERRKIFQPTLPARGATRGKKMKILNLEISTHAPRTGSDLLSQPVREPERKFQPTLPARGATPTATLWRASHRHFNPRSPHGERRSRCRRFARAYPISTHAPRTGSDTRSIQSSRGDVGFQPTLPARGATRELRVAPHCR